MSFEPAAGAFAALLDVQGYERAIVDGAGAALDEVVGTEVETSLVPLYRDEAVLSEMVSRLERRGFVLMRIDPEFADPDTGQMLQVNGMFFRPSR